MRIALFVIFALYVIEWVKNAPSTLSKEKYQVEMKTTYEKYMGLKERLPNIRSITFVGMAVIEFFNIVLAFWLTFRYPYLWFCVIAYIRAVDQAHSFLHLGAFIDSFEDGTYEKYEYDKYGIIRTFFNLAFYVIVLYFLIRGM